MMNHSKLLTSCGIFLLLSTTLLLFTVSCRSKKSIAQNQITIRKATIFDFQKLENLAVLGDLTRSGNQFQELTRSCLDIEKYRYDSPTSYLDFKRTIRVNIHFINSLDSTASYNADTGIKYAKGVIRYANGKLQDNRQMKLPVGNETPIHPLPFRYKLVGDPNISGDEGIYFHYQKDPYFLNYGRKKNNYDRKIIEKYAINMDSVLNIFYMVHPPDSVRSKTYRAKGAGIALGNALKLGVNPMKKADEWTYSGLLNHEVGHVFGLSHAWTKNDGCDDTPPHDNCWNSGPAPCDGVTSNNVMDYNSTQNAFSPCQIGKMNRNLSKVNSRVRELAIPEWCAYDPDKDLVVSDTSFWNRHADYNGNITVANNGILFLHCHLSMAKSTSITIKPGGQLILAKSTIYNDCGKEWDGIQIESSNGISGKLSYVDTFYMQNIDSSAFYISD